MESGLALNLPVLLLRRGISRLPATLAWAHSVAAEY
jgi:hypothetical protein